MYQINDTDTVNTITSYCRTWRLLLYDKTKNKAYMGEMVNRASSEAQTSTQPENIEFGAICSTQWTVTIYNPDKAAFLGDEIDLSLFLISYGDAVPVTWAYLDSLGYTWADIGMFNWKQLDELGRMIGAPIPMGKFVCVKSLNVGDTAELTLCDRLYFSDKPYVPQITLPASSIAIEEDILSQLGIPSGLVQYEDFVLETVNDEILLSSEGKKLTVQSYRFNIQSVPEDCTMREMLSYIASAQGQFGRIDRQGLYVRSWYGSPAFTFDNNTINAPTLSEKPNYINQIKCGDLISRKWSEEGQLMEFENPFMTQSLLNTLARQVEAQGYRWYTADIRHILGDPRLDPGDTVRYVDSGGNAYIIPVTNIGFGFDGGLWADIHAAGMSYEEVL